MRPPFFVGFLLLVLLVVSSSPTLLCTVLATNGDGISLVDVRDLVATDIIVGVKSFLTLFVSVNSPLAANFSSSNSTINELVQFLGKNQIIGTNQQVAIGVSQQDNLRYFNKWLSFNNISSSHDRIISTTVINPTLMPCGRNINPFESFGGVLMDTYNFTYFVRGYRDYFGDQKTKSANGLINSYDFKPFPLIPSMVYIKNRNGMSIEGVNASQNVYEISPMTCENSNIADAEILRFLTGYSMFTPLHIQTLEYVLNISLQYDTSLLTSNQASFLALNNLTSLYWSNDYVMSRLFPSTCHFCTTTNCLGENFINGDYFIIAYTSLTLIYFICLFSTGSFKLPSLKRRMLVPYIPLLSWVMFILFTSFMSFVCSAPVHYVAMVITIYWVLIYTFTVIRFVYLRNLYQIISTSNHKKMHRFLASSKFGFVFTGLFSFGLALVISSDGIFCFFTDSSTSVIFRTINLFAYFIIGCLIAMLALVIDMVMNRKKIKQDGIMKFLLFDDPFHIRIDLISFFLIFLIALGIVIGLLALPIDGSLGPVGGFLNTVACFCILMICGGNSMIVEIVNKIRFRGVEKKEQSELENLLATNASIRELLTEYSRNEYSLENVLCFEKIRQWSNNFEQMDKTVSLNDLLKFEEEFVRTYAKYEVNISHSTKEKFLELVETCRNLTNQVENVSLEDATPRGNTSRRASGVTIQQLYKVIMLDLMFNIGDTFSRLQRTEQYIEWKAINSLQEHIQDTPLKNV